MKISSGHKMNKITQAVILAGGQGKRLKPFTDNNPKPMLPINGKPFLVHLIELLKENNIKEVIILTGYLGDKIKQYFDHHPIEGVRIKYSYTPLQDEKNQEAESGLRLKNAEKLLNDYFLLLYCDNYWPLKLQNLMKFLNKHPSDVLVTAYSNLDNSTKNNILIKNGSVAKYDPSREKDDLNGIDIGFFIVNKKVIKLLPNTNSKFENIVLPKLIKKRRLSGYLSDQKYYSISDLTRAKMTAKFLAPKKVIFLDRDGVINKRPSKGDYVKKWEEFEFLLGAVEAIKLLHDNDYKIFIITNQSGIARGMLTKRNLNLIHKNMEKQLAKKGAKIAGIYYCPHGWDDDKCYCRKPKPGLLLQASREHFIDLTKTIFIGDDERDIQAGESAGSKTFIVNSERSLLEIVRLLTE